MKVQAQELKFRAAAALDGPLTPPLRAELARLFARADKVDLAGLHGEVADGLSRAQRLKLTQAEPRYAELDAMLRAALAA